MFNQIWIFFTEISHHLEKISNNDYIFINQFTIRSNNNKQYKNKTYINFNSKPSQTYFDGGLELLSTWAMSS